MKSVRLMSTLALASALSLGLAAGQLQAASTDAGQESSSAGEVISDTWITTKIKTELATTKGVASHDIKVKTKDGIVTLTGVLPDATAIDKAEAVAKSVKGVKDVDTSALKKEG